MQPNLKLREGMPGSVCEDSEGEGTHLSGRHYPLRALQLCLATGPTQRCEEH